MVEFTEREIDIINAVVQEKINNIYRYGYDHLAEYSKELKDIVEKINKG